MRILTVPDCLVRPTGLGFPRMKLPLQSWPFGPRGSRRGRPRQTDYEHSNYPTKLALSLWEHVTSIGVFNRYPRGYEIQRKGNRQGYLLHYVRKGEIQHVVGGKTYRVSGGCACLMNCGKPYRHFNDQPSAADLWWMAFDGQITPRMWVELGTEQNPFFDNLNRERFETLFKELWILVVKKPLGCEVKCHVTLNAILAELMVSRMQLARASSLISGKSSLSDKVRGAVEIFERNYYYPRLSLKDAGTRLGIDIFQLSRKFRREVGMPPIQYLNHYRIEQARHLLMVTDNPVKEIAPMVGILDPDYFAQLFRKITGQTPRDHRKAGRQSSPNERRARSMAPHLISNFKSQI